MERRPISPKRDLIGGGGVELSNYGSINDVSKRTSFPPFPMRPIASIDEFGDMLDQKNDKSNANKIMRTGRQRKKVASRSKGGEFSLRRKKRRVYFCCVSNEIDIEQLHDNFDKKKDPKWKSKMYEGVLHLYTIPSKIEMNSSEKSKIDNLYSEEDYFQGSPDGYDGYLSSTKINEESDTNDSYNKSFNIPASPDRNNQNMEYSNENYSNENDILNSNTNQNSNQISQIQKIKMAIEVAKESILPVFKSLTRQLSDQSDKGEDNDSQTASMLCLNGGKEIFIYDFGAIVFWGFKIGEEIDLLEQIRDHVGKDRYGTVVLCMFAFVFVFAFICIFYIYFYLFVYIIVFICIYVFVFVIQCCDYMLLLCFISANEHV